MKKKKKNLLPKVGKYRLKNKFELETYKDLKNRLPLKRRVEYEVLDIPYEIHAIYKIDFIFKKRDGNLMCIETKGNGRAFDASVRRKMIAARDQNPDLDIRILFYRDGKIGPVRKDGTFRRQSDWAKDNNFEFAIGKIPDDWLEE